MALSVLNSLRASKGQSPLSLAEAVDQQFLEYVAFPDALKGKYQSFTQADLTQLRAAGYDKPFYTVEQGVERYVQHLLKQAC